MNIVRELRLRAGMQQKDLAISAGVSRPTVSEWEHNKKDPSGERLKRLSEIFGVDPGVILGYRSFDAPAQNTQGGPKTAESRIISEGIDRMPPEDREKALAVLRDVYTEYFESAENKMA